MKAKPTAKAQITVPKAVRQKLNLREGDLVSFDEVSPGKWVFSKSTGEPGCSAFGAANGLRKKDVSPRAEDMDAAIAAEAKAAYWEYE